MTVSSQKIKLFKNDIKFHISTLIFFIWVETALDKLIIKYFNCKMKNWLKSRKTSALLRAKIHFKFFGVEIRVGKDVFMRQLQLIKLMVNF